MTESATALTAALDIRAMPVTEEDLDDIRATAEMAWSADGSRLACLVSAKLALPFAVVAAFSALSGIFASPITTLTRTLWRYRFEHEEDREDTNHGPHARREEACASQVRRSSRRLPPRELVARSAQELSYLRSGPSEVNSFTEGWLLRIPYLLLSAENSSSE